MAAEVHSDLSLVLDEDVLRRMWADTEDFGRKKEIRARMYKLREQRLKDFYTAGDVGQITRKHASTRHTESIGDQGFLSMKSKEIRDSESPTRDFSRALITRNNDDSGYWNSRQESENFTKTLDDGSLMKETFESTEGRGTIRGANCETELAVGSENKLTKVSKSDDNSVYEAEALNQSSKMASVTKTDNGEISEAQSESYNVSKSHEESKPSDQQATSKSWSTSSRSVTSSSKRIVSSSSYVTSSDVDNAKTITSGDSSNIFTPRVDDLRNMGDTQIISDTLLITNDGKNENDLIGSSEPRESLLKSTVNHSEKSTSSSTAQQSSSTTSKKYVTQTVQSKSQKLSENDIQDNTAGTITKVTTITGTQKLPSNVPREEVNQVSNSDTVQVREVVDLSKTGTSETNESNKRISKAESVRSETESMTNQKILTEIQKLDSYLSTHTPAASTPVSPLSTSADVANWMVVSKDNRDNEFTYESRRDSQVSERVPEKVPTTLRSQEKHDKNSSSIDLPKEAAEGQYVTTYQSHYQKPNRISVDNTPSHDYFASTLRASPDRQTPSPTKSKGSRNSLDRSSPERKWRSSPRNTTSPSTERGTPDRPPSRPSDRKTPERKQRTPTAKTPDRESARKSPLKSPERDRRPSTGSYTIERPRSETRRKSEVHTETKTRRKFSSTQQKQEAKARASTPGTSPTSSPTRKPKEKESTDSDSDNSQATFKKSKSDIHQTTEERRTASLSKQNDLQKEETSEYFSEGSITNELTKKSHEPSPERSAFTPIKNFRTNPESGTFIKGERMQVNQETEISKKDGKGTTVEEMDITVTTTDKKVSEQEMGIKGVLKQKPRSPSPSPERSVPKSCGKEPKKPTEAIIVPSKTKPQDRTDTASVANKNVDSKKQSKVESTVTIRTTKDEGQQQTISILDQNKKVETRNEYPTDYSRSASVSPERKTPVQDKKRSPERKAPKSPDHTPNCTPSPRSTEKSPSVSPARNSQSKNALRAQGKSPSPDRKTKSPRGMKISDASPERPSNSPSSSPEYTPIKRRSPERKPTSTTVSGRPEQPPATKSEERWTNNVAKQTTIPVSRSQDTSTTRRSSIPKSDKRLTPKNSRDNVLQRPQDRPTTHRQPLSTNKPVSTIPQRQPTRSPQKVSPSTTVKTTEVIQRRTTKPSPTTTVTSRTTTKTTTVQVSRTPEKPKASTPQTVSKLSTYGTPRKSPQVINKKPASPATTPKGHSNVINKTINSKTASERSAPVPSRNQPHKPKEPVRKPTLLTTRNQTQTKTTSKTQSQLKSRQLIEAECECTSDLEDVTPPEHFDVEIDDVEEPKEQYEEIDTKTLIKSRINQQKITLERVKNDRKLKKRDTKTNDELSSSEDETDAPNGTKSLRNAENTSDYLHVVVQHPKSSRESSPGYTSERIPLSTTSDDGESNPRYADFVSEPEDVEIFDTLRGGKGPIPLKEDIQTTDLDETDISRTSVADKVNVFLEAAKNSLEGQDHHQTVEIDSKNSVRSAKTLFESISKAQATNVQTNKKDLHDHQDVENKQVRQDETPSKPTQTIQKPETKAPDSSKPKGIISKPAESSLSPTKPEVSELLTEFQGSRSLSKPSEDLFSSVKTIDSQSSRSPRGSAQPISEPKEPVASNKKPSGATTNRDELDEGVFTKTHAYEERTPANEPAFERKKAYVTCEREEILETTNFKEREIEENQKTTVRKDTPIPESIATTMAKKSKKPFERNISASADVNSKRSFFERKVQEEGKEEPKEDVRPVRKEVAGRKRSTGSTDSSFMKSTVVSTLRAQSPEKVRKPLENNLTSEEQTEKKSDEQRKESVPQLTGREITSSQKKEVNERESSSEISSTRTIRRQSPAKETPQQSTPGRETSPTQKKEVDERKSSTEISSVRTVRRQSPSKEPQTISSPKDRTYTPSKSFEQEDLRSPLKVRDSNTILRSNETEDTTTKSSGKFGVTLRKTSSNAKMIPTESVQPSKKASTTGETVVIEEIFDLAILEKMLIKAVAYEERRRVRAQIRLVKNQLEEEHNRSGNRPTPTSSNRPWAPKEKSPERNSSTSRRIEETNKFKGEERWSSSRRSPERKPSSEFKQTSYREVITSTQTKTRESPERRLTSQKSRDSPERRLSKSRVRDSPEKILRQPTTSSPEMIVRQPSRSSPERRVPQTDDRNQVTTYQATVKTQSSRNITTEVKGLATDSITSSYGVGPTDDDGKPLFGLRALRRTNTDKALGEFDEQEEVVIQSEVRRESASEDILDSSGRPLFGGLKALQSESMPAQTSQLKELVGRNQILVQGGSRLESTKTVVTSHSSVSSDGKVSHRRDVVRGELMAKNGEQPVGKITQSTYSYQNDTEKGSTPQISSKTVTSLIGGRRDSGPRIEEITDGSQSHSTSRRYSKEYTVEEDSSVTTDRRRSSTGLNEDNVRAFTSILKNKDAGVRKSSLENSETEIRTSKSSSQDESSKKPLTRGDSIKALQHKYQQATVSSSMKNSSTAQSSRTTDVDGAVLATTQTRTSEDSRTIRTASTGSPTVSQTTTRTEVRTGGTSFLDNSSKVTGVQDVLQRMRNADLVSETGDTTEDVEARALLNKFLGASVILQGMEQGMKAAAAQSSTTLVNQVDKQWVKATSQRTQDDLADIYDEKQLQLLLDSCADYEERRKIRAKLRDVMAEKKDNAETAGVVSKTGQSFSKTEVQTRVVSSPAKLTKANSIQSPFAKFKQLERQNSAPSVSRAGSFTFTSSASSIKERLLEWVQAQTRDYKNVQIENFSTSWSNGLAFCALIHHFCPDAFDYTALTPQNQRHNFQLAFTVAEEKADIYPLLDVEDMVMMSRPDWKCVFTYVQSIHRRFHDSLLSNPTNPYL